MRTDNWMQWRNLDRMLKKKKDINEKTGEYQKNVHFR